MDSTRARRDRARVRHGRDLGLARAPGLRPVAVDFATAQLRTAEMFQREFGFTFPLVLANAEQVPFDNESFDLAVSEYGASLWCSPHKWLPEAHRLLRPEGRLIFFTTSALLLTCTPADGGPATIGSFGITSRGIASSSDRRASNSTSHTGTGFDCCGQPASSIDDLIEVQPAAERANRASIGLPEWAQRWPSEEIWVAHKAGSSRARGSELEALAPRHHADRAPEDSRGPCADQPMGAAAHPAHVDVRDVELQRTRPAR